MGSIKTPVVVTYCGKPFRCTSQTYSRLLPHQFLGGVLRACSVERRTVEKLEHPKVPFA